MSIKVQCSCGTWLETRDEFVGKRCQCPACAAMVEIPEVGEGGEDDRRAAARADAAPPIQSTPIVTREHLDPHAPKAASALQGPDADKISVFPRMFEALLDPRSIQWMMMIGGGLSVLGIVIWLVSLGVFEDPLVLAGALGIGTAAILGAGWFVALRTKFQMAGRGLTFLGCVIAPLNLWFYHAQDLITVDGHLWAGGVICCLLYAATVVVLRDPLFMYAFEAGATLTLLLLLADLGKITDPTFLSLFFMVIGLASIHAERAFSASKNGTFTRQKYGLPLFWSGHAQVAVSLLVLLSAQLLDWLLNPTRALLSYEWPGTLITDSHLLAGGLWLAATYAYLYSDIVVRRIGVYLALAGFSLVMAEMTLLLGFDMRAELVIAVLALTALAVNLFRSQIAMPGEKLARVIPPLAIVLSGLPVFAGVLLHLRATSPWAANYQWAYVAGWDFVVAMVVVAVSNQVSAYLFPASNSPNQKAPTPNPSPEDGGGEFEIGRKSKVHSSSIYFVFSAASVLIAAAASLRVLGLTEWSHQAPWMMIVPITYLIASRVWRGHNSERPLGWIAHVAMALILMLVVLTSLRNPTSFVPAEGVFDSLLLGLVLAEVSVFYVLAGLFRKRSANVYLAAAAACGALWQFMGYYGIDSAYYTMLYAGLGVACLALARGLGLKKATISGGGGDKRLALSGRGLAAFQSGNGILMVACLAAFMQGIAGLGYHGATWFDLGALSMTVLASALATAIVPSGTWRRLYLAATVALAAVTLLRLNLLIDLSGWQKLEILCVAAGVIMLIASHIARFRETEGIRDETVSLGLWLDVLATVPLLVAFAHHRWIGAGPSLYDEMALLTVTILMAVTGVSWQTKATTFFGGGLLTFYLIVLVVSLAYRPQTAIGVYLAVGGAVVFAAGIALSIYRDRLLELPKQISRHEGVFRVLNWR